MRCAGLDQIDRTGQIGRNHCLSNQARFADAIPQAGASKSFGQILPTAKPDRMIFHHVKNFRVLRKSYLYA
jgi:hypothetical protein